MDENGGKGLNRVYCFTVFFSIFSHTESFAKRASTMKILIGEIRSVGKRLETVGSGYR